MAASGADCEERTDLLDRVLFGAVLIVLLALPFPLRLGTLGVEIGRSATVPEVLTLALLPLWLAAELRRGGLRRIVLSPLHLPMWVLLVWSILAAMAATADPGAAFKQVARLLGAVTLYFAMLRTLESTRRMMLAGAALVAPVLLIALLAVAERFASRDSLGFLEAFALRTGFLPSAQVIRAQATFPHPNVLAQVLEATLVLLAGTWAAAAADPAGRRRHRLDLFAVASTALLAAALAFTYSRAGLVAVGAGLGLLVGLCATCPALRPHARRAAVAAATTAIVVLAIGAGDRAWRQRVLPGSGHEQATGPSRGELWQGAVRTIAAHPVLGVGPDNFRRIDHGDSSLAAQPSRGAATSRSSGQHSHSLYLEAALDAGLPGLAALVWALTAIGHRLAAVVVVWRGGTEAVLACAAGGALVTFLIHGLVDLVVRQHSLLALFWATAALTAAAAGEAGRVRGAARASAPRARRPFPSPVR